MKGAIVSLSFLARILRKIITSSSEYDDFNTHIDCGLKAEIKVLHTLPDDVKEGHFVVHTLDDGELSRSIVELSFLTDPGFMKLLDQAEEEYGFKQTGILSIPCRFSELQTVLGIGGSNEG